MAPILSIVMLLPDSLGISRQASGRSVMRVLLVVAIAAAALTWAPVALAFERGLFPLNDAQLEALQDYGQQRGEKAFAASADGYFASASGMMSATIAAREALKGCVAQASSDPCILIDLNGAQVPLALQLAQAAAADPKRLEAPAPLSDLSLSPGAWRALQDLHEKPDHKAFALSLNGVWARAWEAASAEEASKEALETCNKNERAKAAPCFIYELDGKLASEGLTVNPDLSVSQK